jgi:hypothetical protein
MRGNTVPMSASTRAFALDSAVCSCARFSAARRSSDSDTAISDVTPAACDTFAGCSSSAAPMRPATWIRLKLGAVVLRFSCATANAPRPSAMSANDHFGKPGTTRKPASTSAAMRSARMCAELLAQLFAELALPRIARGDARRHDAGRDRHEQRRNLRRHAVADRQIA